MFFSMGFTLSPVPGSECTVPYQIANKVEGFTGATEVKLQPHQLFNA
jgi:hypothetical protein